LSEASSAKALAVIMPAASMAIVRFNIAIRSLFKSLHAP
jgi:hypothetical protein